MAAARRSRLASIAGTPVGKARARGRRWPQEEYLKKKGRSSVAGEMSKG
jgi:hypothetical protein